MKLFKTLESLMPPSDCKRFGYFGDSIATRQFCNYYAKMHDAELFHLKDLPLTRWRFGGEFFDAMIVEDDALLEKGDHIKMLKKALQREQNLIFVSENLQLDDVEAKLESYGFNEFKAVSSDPFIVTAKKWFAY